MKRMAKQNKDMKLLFNIIDTLANDEDIPAHFKPHPLKGRWKNYLECPIQADWLLIWKEDKKGIYLVRTGSHSDLFKK